MIEPRPVMRPPSLGEAITPADAMRWAFILARKGAGFVLPNPMVGCVIVDADHKFVTGGWHTKVGFPHAEIEALDRFATIKGSREALAGCHLYVTLEPCSHEGRTGSCAKALVPLKPASVTYALVDPNPQVAGTGAKILNEAGVKTASLAESATWPALPGRAIEDVVKQELIDEAEDMNEVFLHCMRKSGPGALPFVTVKVASSLDGRVSMNTGESKWITSELSREKGHRLRLEHDAILVGRKTVENDNPLLNVRLSDVTDHSNAVVLVDPKAKLIDRLLDFEISRVRPPSQIFICTQIGVADPAVVAKGRSIGFRTFEVGGPKEGVIDLRIMLEKLRDYGISGLFVEGGAGTVGPMIHRNLVNRLHVFMSTAIIGGKHARGWSDECGGVKLKDAWKLKRQRVKMIGDDLHVTGRLD